MHENSEFCGGNASMEKERGSDGKPRGLDTRRRHLNNYIPNVCEILVKLPSPMAVHGMN